MTDPSGTEAIVLTDGVENIPPFIVNITEEVVNSGMTIHSILYTNKTVPLQNHLPDLARQTGEAL